MVDEVSDNRSIKHLALCTKYINPAGQLQTSFLVDVTNSIVSELGKKRLLLIDVTGLASDGAAVFLGKVWCGQKTKRATNPSALSSANTIDLYWLVETASTQYQ